jgi:CheY-like chemotaxis protein
MPRAPLLLHLDDDDARAARVAELVRYARPDLLLHRRAHRGEVFASPDAPDVTLVPAALAHTHRGDGQRIIVLCDGPTPTHAPPEARLVRTPSELLGALAAWAPPSPQRLQVVLLVDDEAQLLRALKRIFEDHLGVRVVTAEDNASGLAAARRERPDVIISDLNRPCGSGRQFVEALLANEQLSDTPVIIHSGFSRSSGNGDWAGAVGLVALLNKPQPREEMVDVLAFALGRTTSERWEGPSHPRGGHEIPLDPRTLPVNVDWRRRRREYLDAQARLRR